MSKPAWLQREGLRGNALRFPYSIAYGSCRIACGEESGIVVEDGDVLELDAKARDLAERLLDIEAVSLIVIDEDRMIINGSIESQVVMTDSLRLKVERVIADMFGTEMDGTRLESEEEDWPRYIR